MENTEKDSRDYSYYVKFSENELKILKNTYENKIKILEKNHWTNKIKLLDERKKLKIFKIFRVITISIFILMILSLFSMLILYFIMGQDMFQWWLSFFVMPFVFSFMIIMIFFEAINNDGTQNLYKELKKINAVLESKKAINNQVEKPSKKFINVINILIKNPNGLNKKDLQRELESMTKKSIDPKTLNIYLDQIKDYLIKEKKPYASKKGKEYNTEVYKYKL